MPRPLRIDVEDGWHHVMNRGIDHGDVFFDDTDRIEFGQRLADVHERFGVEFHAYCLLDNHFHLLCRCPHGGLSAAMQRIGSIYTRHVNDRLGRDGALFRGRFHSRLITDDAHLIAAIRYIHRNALDVEGVDSVRKYRWSSHRAYLGLRTPPSWLRTDRLFEGWTVEEIDRFVELPRDDVAAPADFDVSGLVRGMELILSERGLSSERRLGAVARQLALVVLLDESQMSEGAVMQAFGIERLGALRTAASRARALLRAEPELLDAQRRGVNLLFAAPITARV
jgi:REP element-mobilizing transposase RayT